MAFSSPPKDTDIIPRLTTPINFCGTTYYMYLTCKLNCCFTEINPEFLPRSTSVCVELQLSSEQEPHRAHTYVNQRLTKPSHWALRVQPERSDKASREIKYFLVYITTKTRQSPLANGLAGRRGEQLLRRFENKPLLQFSMPRGRAGQGRTGQAWGRAGPVAPSRAPLPPAAAQLLRSPSGMAPAFVCLRTGTSGLFYFFLQGRSWKQRCPQTWFFKSP